MFYAMMGAIIVLAFIAGAEAVANRMRKKAWARLFAQKMMEIERLKKQLRKEAIMKTVEEDEADD